MFFTVRVGCTCVTDESISPTKSHNSHYCIGGGNLVSSVTGTGVVALRKEDIEVHIESQLRKQIVKLTRFSADHVDVCGVERDSAKAVASFVYTILLNQSTEEGTGPTGSGRERGVNDKIDTGAELERVANSQRERLVPFASSQAQSLVPNFDEAQFTETVGYAFLSHPCSACSRTGQQTCDQCSGLLQVNCGPCYGRGTVNCGTCNGSSFVTESCYACHGTGTRYENVYEPAYNPLTGQYENTMRSVMRSCTTCHGNPNQSAQCRACLNGQTPCNDCQSSGRITCPRCAGSGQMTCLVCSGTRGSHLQYLISSEIQESSCFDAADISEDHWLHAHIGAKVSEPVSEWDAPPPEWDSRQLVLRRNLTIPYAVATATVGSESFEVRAIGSDLTICDYGNIGDILLSPEIEVLPADNTLEGARIVMKDLAASDINSSALDALSSAEPSAPASLIAEKFSAGTDRFVSAGHIERLYQVALSLVTNAFLRAHRRGLLLAFLLGVVALVTVIAMKRFAPEYDLPVWVPLTTVILVGLSTELVARIKGPLGVRICTNSRGATLLRRSRFQVWSRYAGYVTVGLALTLIAVRTG